METRLRKPLALRAPFLFLLAAYLFLQGWQPDIERFIFWGEGISLILFFSCFRVDYRDVLQKRIIYALLVWIIFMPVYGVVSTIFMWDGNYELNYLLRHLSFFYYALFFFAGYQAGPPLIEKLSRYWRWILPLVLLLIYFIGGGIGSSIVLGFVWLVCQRGNQKKWMYYLIPLGIILLHAYAGRTHGTSKLISAFLIVAPVLVFMLRLWHQTGMGRQLSRYFFRAFLLCGVVLLVIAANHMVDLIYKVIAAGGTFHQFFNDFQFTDANGVWRIMLWTYLFDRFTQHPLGIGLGTPLVGQELADFMYLLQKPGDEYTSGAHNSFITFLVRLGVPFIIFFAYVCFNAGRMIIRFLHRTGFRVLDSAETRFVFAAILAMLVGVIHACFNVVLESPIAAGIFWFQFGLFVRIVGDFLAKTEAEAHA